MKKKPNKLPFELHDPKPPALNAAGPLDLSDQVPAPRDESVLPQPQQTQDGDQPTGMW